MQKLAMQEKLVNKEPVKKEEQLQLVKGQFYASIELNFTKKGIKIQSAEMAQKDKEYDFTIRLPTPAGELTYYCKAKAKKRVSEGDLSAAVLKAQSRRLPALFLTDGELTKKAEKFLNDELKDQIKVMKI